MNAEDCLDAVQRFKARFERKLKQDEAFTPVVHTGTLEALFDWAVFRNAKQVVVRCKQCGGTGIGPVGKCGTCGALGFTVHRRVVMDW